MLVPLLRNGPTRSRARECIYHLSLISRVPILVKEVRFKATWVPKDSPNQSTVSGYIPILRHEDQSSRRFKHGDQENHEDQEDDRAQGTALEHKTSLDLIKPEENTAVEPIDILSHNDENDRKSPDSAWDNALKALLQQDPHKLLRAFVEATRDRVNLQSLPSTTFSEIIRMLDPIHFVDPYRAVYQDIHPKQISGPKHGTPRISDLFYSYSGSIGKVISNWHKIGRSIGFVEYKALLNVARAVGNGKMAHSVIASMRRVGLEMDIECYNYYFEAKCWSRAYDDLQRMKLRVIPHNYRSRLPDKRTRRFSGYQTGPKGLKHEIINIFSSMVEKGIVADVNTFRHLMTAMGREGDLRNVKAILRSVWGVDVDVVSGQIDESPDLGHSISRGSPVYPTEDVLFSIAHVFGSNNDIPLALRIIDRFSRKYAIKINMETWEELFKWTFILACPLGRNKFDGQQLGRLPKTSTEQLWTLLISEPYNINPGITIWNYRIKMLRKQNRLEEMLDVMRSVPKRPSFQSVCLDYSPRTPKSSLPAEWQSVDIAKLHELRNFTMTAHWVRLILSRGGARPRWERREVPNIIAEYFLFGPKKGFTYKIGSGRIENLRSLVIRSFFHIDWIVDKKLKIVAYAMPASISSIGASTCYHPSETPITPLSYIDTIKVESTL